MGGLRRLTCLVVRHDIDGMDGTMKCWRNDSVEVIGIPRATGRPGYIGFASEPRSNTLYSPFLGSILGEPSAVASVPRSLYQILLGIRRKRKAITFAVISMAQTADSENVSPAVTVSVH